MNLNSLIKDASLKKKLTLYSIVIIILSSAVINIVSISKSKIALSESITNNLVNVAQLKADKIAHIFKTLSPSLSFAQNFPEVKQQFLKLKSNYSSMNYDSIYETSRELDGFLSIFREEYSYDNVQLVTKEGEIIFGSYSKGSLGNIGVQFKYFGTKYFKNSLSKEVITPVFKSNGKFFVYFLAPVFDRDLKTTGVIACKYEMSDVFSVVLDYTGLGETGETLLGEIRGDEVVFLNPLRHDPNAALKRKVMMGSESALPIQESASGNNGNGFDVDYRGEEVIAAWVAIPGLDWGLVSKIDVSEAYAPIYALQYQIIFATLIILIIAFVIAIYFANNISKPILNLESSLFELGQGKLPPPIEHRSKDEIGMMIVATNKLIGALGDTAEFADKIGSNELEAEFTPLGDEDVLGKSLLNMRGKLKEAKEFEFKRNWVTKGLAQFASVLRENNDNLENLSIEIITGIVKYLNANQGGIFIKNDDVRDPKMELIATYAYDRRKYQEKTFSMGEGLIGQCWQEGERIYLTDIPQGYLTITSGLGEASPTSVLLIPLHVNEQTHGVIEVASFEEFEEYQIEFIEKLAESIASTISNTKTNLNTTYLLQESKEMTEEMRAQEEEMRQNMEEMQATQEEMERSKIEMEYAQTEMKNIKYALYNSAIVSETDRKGVITKVNKRFCDISGYTEDELVGQPHNMVRHPDMPKEAFKDMWSTIGRGKVWMGRVKNLRKDGSFYWVLASISPIIGKDDKPESYFAIRFDITNQVAQEQEMEQSMEMMQATFESFSELGSEKDKLIKELTEEIKELKK